MADYLAKFESETGVFYSLAASWPGASRRVLPSAWWQVLRDCRDVDIALRLNSDAQPAVVLLLTSDTSARLRTVSQQLRAASNMPGLQFAATAEQFDALTDPPLPETQLRVSHEGYHREGKPLGCDFRLFSAWAGNGLPKGVAYQVALRGSPSEPEQQRRVRKYLAWLDVESPYTPPVREMQRILSSRLLDPGWLADEYLIFDDAAQGDQWYQRICDQFTATTGRIGFSEPPVEKGDFSAWLITGCHTARDAEERDAVPVQGAYIFSEEEVDWLLEQHLGEAQAAATQAPPEVFISYASADFTLADAVRQHLEDSGRRCWIAPRDINSGSLPYTEAISKAIKQVSAVVMLLSPSANLSVHIPRELDLALEQQRAIIPMRLEAIAPTGQLEYLLRTCQWLDLFDRPQQQAMRELDQRLSSLDKAQSLRG